MAIMAFPTAGISGFGWLMAQRNLNRGRIRPADSKLAFRGKAGKRGNVCQAEQLLRGTRQGLSPLLPEHGVALAALTL